MTANGLGFGPRAGCPRLTAVVLDAPPEWEAELAFSATLGDAWISSS